MKSLRSLGASFDCGIDQQGITGLDLTELNANGNNIEVGRNFLINPTGTLTSGANTLIFNGNSKG
jgi:hypothetical protein